MARKIKINRFQQDSAYCTVAAISSIANYFDRDMDYDNIKKAADKYLSANIDKTGLFRGQVCKLFNLVGFKKVTFITSDISIFDYHWSKYNKTNLMMAIKEAMSIKKNKLEITQLSDIYDWYKNKKYNNVIKIDYEFGRHIRRFIDKGVPVLVTFNWNMFFKFAKCHGPDEIDPFNGESEDHAVVINGYDRKGAWIVDSNNSFCKYSRKKYETGYYRIGWESLFTCMGQGDIVVGERYEKNEKIV